MHRIASRGLASWARFVLAITVAASVGCSAAPAPNQASGGTPRDVLTSNEVVSAVKLDSDTQSIGEGTSFGSLTVFPVLAKRQPDLGAFTTLDDALAAKTAEVREQEGGATVNALVIENKGQAAIFVLAGTVVKGGKQDRQIGQDFVVGSAQVVPVDAFCVEHGRWNTERAGVVTQGKFGTMQTLANSQVRAAGQHKKSQGEVWKQVAETNAATGKAPATGTLAASIEEGDVAARRKAIADKITAHLDTLAPQRDIVGLAYAVDGEVKGVRWFANHDIYRLYQATLVNTAALEAIAAPKPAAGAKPAPPSTAAQVKAFVKEVSASKVTEERTTPGENVNDYRESTTGYGARTKMKSQPSPKSASAGTPAAAAPPAAKPADVELSADFVKK